MSFRLSSCGGVSRHSAALNTQQIINKSIVFIKNFFIAHHFFLLYLMSAAFSRLVAPLLWLLGLCPAPSALISLLCHSEP